MPGLYRSAEGEARLRGWCERRLARWPVPHERRVIDTSLGQTHLLEAGSGPLTVLHLCGTNFGVAASLGLVEALAATARVVVADLPGQPGLSAAARPQGHRLAAYGRWAGEVVAACGGAVVLSGHSLGAAVALAAPTSGVSALLLLDPAGLVRLRVTPAVLAATLPWLIRPTPARSGRLLAHMTAPGRVPGEDLVAWMTLVARYSRTTGAPPPLPEHVTSRWRRTPRLVLVGEHDCFLPPGRLAVPVRQRLGVEVQVLAGTGHLAPEEDPGAVARRLALLLDD